MEVIPGWYILAKLSGEYSNKNGYLVICRVSRERKFLKILKLKLDILSVRELVEVDTMNNARFNQSASAFMKHQGKEDLA